MVVGSEKGVVCFVCTEVQGGWASVVLTYTGRTARRPPMLRVVYTYSLVLYNYRCTDTATVIIYSYHHHGGPVART